MERFRGLPRSVIRTLPWLACHRPCISGCRLPQDGGRSRWFAWRVSSSECTRPGRPTRLWPMQRQATWNTMLWTSHSQRAPRCRFYRVTPRQGPAFQGLVPQRCVTSGSGSDQHTGHSDMSHALAKKFTRLEDRMRFYGYSVLRIGLGLITLSGVCIYVFREYIRENVADEVSTVASRSLGDEVVLQKAEEASKDLLRAIFSDPNMHKETVLFLEQVFRHPQVQQSVLQLMRHVLSDRRLQQEVTYLLKDLISSALADPAVQADLAAALSHLLDRPLVRDSLLNLVTYAMQDEALRQEAAVFASAVLESSVVTHKATQLGQAAVQDIIADDTIQKKTGDALWTAFCHSIRPAWLSAWSGNSEAKDTDSDTRSHSPVISEADTDSTARPHCPVMPEADTASTARSHSPVMSEADTDSTARPHCP